MTLSQIKELVANYVAANDSANTTYAVTKDNIAELVDKIAKSITIDGLFADKLEALNGEELPLGKTIEEWYEDLCVISDYDANEDPNAPHYPTYQDNAYNYTLGRKVIKTTLKYNEYERAFNSVAEYENIVNMVIKRLYDTYAVFKYGAKKQMISNLIAKAETSAASSNIVKSMNLPVDADTGASFIEQVKADVEAAQFVTEGNSLNAGATVGAAEGLLLIVKKGVKPALEVQVEAGAFQVDKLAVPAEIIVVDDFGSNTDAFAVLIDRRALRLHPTYMAVREQLNGAGDFMNFFLHTENTAFISRNTFTRVYKEA